MDVKVRDVEKMDDGAIAVEDERSMTVVEERFTVDGTEMARTGVAALSRGAM